MSNVCEGKSLIFLLGEIEFLSNQYKIEKFSKNENN